MTRADGIGDEVGLLLSSSAVEHSHAARRSLATPSMAYLPPRTIS